MKIDDIAKQLANKVNQEHYIKHYLEKVQRGAYNKGVKDAEAKQLILSGVGKRCLADIEIEYSHPSGKKKGKLMYDDDYQTLMLKYDGGFINLPNIEDCNVC